MGGSQFYLRRQLFVNLGPPFRRKCQPLSYYFYYPVVVCCYVDKIQGHVTAGKVEVDLLPSHPIFPGNWAGNDDIF